ncbi:hypothetical protein BOX15_Mlig000357g4, partial [Macrostomum lignano]
FIKCCNDPACGTGIRILQPLCEKHIEQDIEIVRDLCKNIQKKLKPLLKLQKDFRMQQQALSAELQETEKLFESAVDSLKSQLFEISGAFDIESNELQMVFGTSITEDSERGTGRTVGDVSGCVRDLQLLIDKHLSDVMQLCESAESLSADQPICEFQSMIKDLPGSPYIMCHHAETRKAFTWILRAMWSNRALTESCHSRVSSLVFILMIR